MVEINISLICLILFSLIFISMFLMDITFDKEQEVDSSKSERLYQGPVQEGFDEELFRTTGRHEKIVEASNNG